MPPKSPAFKSSAQYNLQFKKLYDAFSSLIALKPWLIIHESILIGVRHPQTGVIYYAYFMGSLGEVVGFNLYRDDDVKPWLFARESMQSPDFSHDEMLTHAFFQFSLEKKSKVPAEVQGLHAAIDVVVPRGKSGYLDAITYRGGYTPVQMREEEMAEVLPLFPGFAFLLEEIAEGQLKDPTLPGRLNRFYVASLERDGLWQSSEEDLPEGEPANLFSVELSDENEKKLMELRNKPASDDGFVIQAALLPMPTMNDEGIGIFPLGIFCINAENGMILGFGMLDITTWQKAAAGELIEMLRNAPHLPKALIVSDDRLLPLVEECADVLEIVCIHDEGAKEFTDQVLGGLLGQMGRMS